MENAALTPGPDDDEDDESGPLRKCAATGERRPATEMIRFVLSPDGEAVPDLAQTLPGRGAWVLSARSAVEKAAKGGFSKAFKSQARAPVDLATRIETQLARRMVDLLGFARRAGQITMGFTKVEQALREGTIEVDCLVIASGSGPSDRGKLLQLAARREFPPLVIGLLTADEIGLAFGRENVVHAALERGGLAARIRAEAERLSGFRPLVPKDWGP
jgi:uncharacterized protein